MTIIGESPWWCEDDEDKEQVEDDNPNHGLDDCVDEDETEGARYSLFSDIWHSLPTSRFPGLFSSFW